MITQRVDPEDSVIGFAYVWIKELSKHLEKVVVVCLRKSERTVMERVNIYEIKKRGEGKIVAFLNFIKYCWRAVVNEKVDGVFVHQCPLYVLLIYPIAQMKRVPIILWYAHGKVSLSLRIASMLVKVILTSTKGGCRIRSKKVKVIGQGIDIEKFSPNQESIPRVDLCAVIDGVRVKGGENGMVNEEVMNLEENSSKNDKSMGADERNLGNFGAAKSYGKGVLLSVGRISPVKDYLTIIKAMNYLIKEKGLTNNELMIVGEPLEYKDRKYLEELKREVLRLGLSNYIRFMGAVPYNGINELYLMSDIVISASRTGSLDKVILEAMACGKPVLTSLPVDDVLGGYASLLKYAVGNYIELGEKICSLLAMDKERAKEICGYLRMVVVKEHSLSGLINKIIEEFKYINC